MSCSVRLDFDGEMWRKVVPIELFHPQSFFLRDVDIRNFLVLAPDSPFASRNSTNTNPPLPIRTARGTLLVRSTIACQPRGTRHGLCPHHQYRIAIRNRVEEWIEPAADIEQIACICIVLR